MAGEMVKAEPAGESMPMRARGIVIADMNSLARFCKVVADSGLAPRDFKTPQQIAVAVMYGMELGLSPMQALQSVAVVNGKPGLYGDGALAVVRASGLLEWITEEVTGEGDKRKATCLTKRVGDPKARETTFSVADAKKANLWGKPGPWTQYQDRMLQFRARGFNLRDNFPDVLKGIKTVEELRDYPDEANEPKPVEAPPAAEPKTVQVEAKADAPAAGAEYRSPRLPEVERLLKQAKAAGAIDQGTWDAYLWSNFRKKKRAELNDLECNVVLHHLRDLLAQHAPEPTGDAHEPPPQEMFAGAASAGPYAEGR